MHPAKRCVSESALVSVGALGGGIARRRAPATAERRTHSFRSLKTPPLRSEAFTTFTLQAFDTAKTLPIYNCGTTVVNASDTILPETERQLSCMFIDSGAPDNSQNWVLWNSNWESTGSCTGIESTEYFRLMAEFYPKYNPNEVMKTYGVAPPTVDRDAFLAKLQTAFGKSAWIECTEGRALETVTVCLARDYPYELRDCPFDPLNTSPTSNGLRCQGSLDLPTTASSPAAITTPAQCVPYIKPYDEVKNTTLSPPPRDSSPAQGAPPVSPDVAPPAPPPDDGGGSDVGAIVGGVVGGLALVAAVAAGIVLVRRKRSRDRSSTEGAAAANGTTNGANDANGLPPYAYASPYAAVSDPAFASTPPAGLMAGGAASAAALASRDTGSASYPSTPPSELGGLAFRPSGAAALAADPLMQYINSTLSTQTSRGSLKSWELLFEDITIERPIGEGSWGRVYKGAYHQTQVAVKVLLDNTSGAGANTQSTLVSTNGTVMARLEQEAALMSNLHHPNVVHLLGVCM